MHNIKDNFNKIYATLQAKSIIDFDGDGNIKRPGRRPKFTDLQVISLALTSEYMSIDSENLLFKKIKSCHRDDFPTLIDRSQYNRRRKNLFIYIEKIRQALAHPFLEFEDYMVIDSMPLEVCKMSRARRIKICQEQFQTSPDKGYCATQRIGFYGYKLHGICSVSGVFHSIDLTKASIHDRQILKDLNQQLSDTVVIGDKGYLGKQIQLDLFETASIKLHTPMRKNQINFVRYPAVFKKARKRIETLFSQLCDQFMIKRNYAKSFQGFKTRILTKITALTMVQYINYFDFKRPINNIKQAIT